MRVLVVGLGGAGRRHLSLLRERGDVEAAALSASAAATEGVLGSRDEAAAWRPDAVVVANVTADHAATALWALGLGAHVLVEKPLAATAQDAARVAEAAAASGLRAAVGYNLRFHPALEAVRAAVAHGRVGRLLSVRAEVGFHLDLWRSASGYAGRAAAGGGALLTLSHELDYVSWIAGPVERAVGLRARAGTVTEDADDLAELLCTHRDGVLSSVHMDLLDRTYNRRSRWVGSDASIEWRWHGPAELLAGHDAETLWEDASFDLEETYRVQLADFLDACAGGHEPRCPAAESVALLDAVEAVA